MQKTLTRLFTAVMMAALLISASIMNVSAAGEATCSHDTTGNEFVASTAALTEGTWYVNESFTSEATATITVDGNVTLCLNGNTVTAPNAALTSFLTVNADATLTICGGADGPGAIVGGGDTATRGIEVLRGGTLNLLSGDISGFEAGNIGGGVYVAGTFNMYGGTIWGNKANGTAAANKDDGGGVYVSTATFNMYGGTIAGNYAISDGGGVCMNGKSTFTLDGGTIGGTRPTSVDALSATTGNWAAGSKGNTSSVTNGGGGLMIGSTGTFTMKSGYIKGNYMAATGFNGGGIWTGGSNAKVSLEGGEISYNYSNGKAGGVYVNNTVTTLSGATISHNEAKTEGGGVLINTGKKFTMSSGAISENTAGTDGGGVVATGASTEFTMSGGTISGNISVASNNGGGGVTIKSSATGKFTGGTVCNNTVNNKTYGGGVSASGTGTLEISGTFHSYGNKVAEDKSGGVAKLAGTATGTISGGKFEDGMTLDASNITITGGEYTETAKAQTVMDTLLNAELYETTTEGVTEGYDYKVVRIFGDHTEHTNWYEISGPTAITTSGKYVLTADIEAATTVKGPSGNAAVITVYADDVTVCLAGWDLGSAKAQNLIRVEGGSLELCNCKHETDVSEITNTYTSSARIVQMNHYTSGSLAAPSVTIGAGIKITGLTAGEAAVRVNHGALVLDGAQITGNTANQAVAVNNAAGTFLMKSGEISGNTTKNGAVYVSNGEFTMTNGTVSDSVYAVNIPNANGEATISGGNVGGALYGTASLYTITGGYFSVQPDEAMVGDATITDLGEDVTYRYQVEVVQLGTCPTHTRWTPITGTMTINESGHYVLDNNLNTGNILVTSGAEVTICLNGHSITPDSSSATTGLHVQSGKVTLCNCSSTVSTIYAGKGRAVAVGNNSGDTVGVKDIVDYLTIDSDNITISGSGSDGGVVIFREGKLILNKGTITGSSKESTVRVCGGEFEMNGGTITGNTVSGVKLEKASTDAEVVYGSFTMNNGTISDNEATYGGGVYVDTSCTFTLDGGTIDNNTATLAGGGVYLAAATSELVMEKGTISNNKGTLGGGIAFQSGGTFTMNGGTISNNETTTGNGGGVYMTGWTASPASFTMTGGEITGNTAVGSNGGGGVYIVKTNSTTNPGTYEAVTFTMTGGTISGNKATYTVADDDTKGGKGGGVYSDCAFTMSGDAEVKDNEAAFRGGNVYMTTDSVFTLKSGAKLTGGTLTNATNISGHVIYNFGGTANIYGTMTAVAGASGNSFMNSSAATANVYDGAVITGPRFYCSGTLNIYGGSLDCELMAASTSVFTITGGKFSADNDRTDLVDWLPAAENVTGMLSVMNIVDDTYAYEVGEGFNNKGEHMAFESSLAFSLYLNADVNFTTEGYAGFDVSAVSDDKTYSAKLTVDETTGNLLLTATGIAAKEMHDAITFTVKDGATVLFTDTVSVYDAAVVWAKDEGKTTMVADMINYGIEAQKEFNHNTGNVAALDGGSDTPSGSWTATEEGGVTEGYEDKFAASLNLRERIELNIYVDDTNVAVSNNSAAHTKEEVEDANGKTITRITFGDIAVQDVKTPVTCTVTLSDGSEVAVKYSIADYVIEAKDGTQGALIQALQKYVDSVRAYKGLE